MNSNKNNREDVPMGMYCAIGLAVVIAALEILMTYAALPRMIKVFGDPQRVIWIVTIHYLVGASAAALGGRVGDMFGRRRMLVVALTMTVIGAVISVMSPDFVWLVVGRGVQGGFSAMLIPLCFGIVREYFPAGKLAMGIGFVAVIPAALTGVATLIGGYVVDTYSWRAVYAVSAVASLIALTTVLLFIPARKSATNFAGADWWGGILFAPPVAALLYGINQAKSLGWLHPVIIGFLIFSIAGLVFWYRYELAHKSPLIDVRLLSIRQVALANLSMALFGLGVAQSAQIFPILMQQPTWVGLGLGLTATMSGVALLPGSLLTLFGGPVSGRIANARGGRTAGMLGAALLCGLFAILAVSHRSLWVVVCLSYCIHFSSSVLFAAIPNIIVEATPSERTSETTGMSSVVRMIFLAIGSQLVGHLLSLETVSNPQMGPGNYASNNSFVLAVVTMSVLSFMAGVILWFTSDSRAKAERT